MKKSNAYRHTAGRAQRLLTAATGQAWRSKKGAQAPCSQSTKASRAGCLPLPTVSSRSLAQEWAHGRAWAGTHRAVVAHTPCHVNDILQRLVSLVSLVRLVRLVHLLAADAATICQCPSTSVALDPDVRCAVARRTAWCWWKCG